MEYPKPKRVRARIIRTVTEFATVVLDRDGNIEEILESHEELFSDDMKVIDIRSVVSSYD